LVALAVFRAAITAASGGQIRMPMAVQNDAF
jgi:hypothetical protein